MFRIIWFQKGNIVSMGGDVRKPWVHVLSRDPYENNCRVCIVGSKHFIVVFPSYLALLTLEYGDRMEKSQVAHCQTEEEGLSFREAERVIESKLFLNEYPWWSLGIPSLVSYPAWDVPSCCRMGVKRGRMYVLPRPPKQHTRTSFWGRSIHHGVSRVPNI